MLRFLQKFLWWCVCGDLFSSFAKITRNFTENCSKNSPESFFWDFSRNSSSGFFGSSIEKVFFLKKFLQEPFLHEYHRDYLRKFCKSGNLFTSVFSNSFRSYSWHSSSSSSSLFFSISFGNSMRITDPGFIRKVLHGFLRKFSQQLPCASLQVFLWELRLKFIL